MREPDETPAERAQRKRERRTGLLIVAISIFGAVVTSMAAGAAGDASGLEQRARQAAALRAQIESETERRVLYEKRLADRVADEIDLAAQLSAEAAVRPGSPRSIQVETDAREHRAVARAMQLPFVFQPVDPATGAIAYEHDFVLETTLSLDERLRALAVGALKVAADDARERRTALTAVDTAVIATIFFLTLSLLAPRRRNWFAALGLTTATLAVVGFVVTIAVFTVPEL